MKKNGEEFVDCGRYNSFLQSDGLNNSYDNIIDYYDGKFAGTYNLLLLEAQQALLQLGKNITISRNETVFSGTLSSVSSKLSYNPKLFKATITWHFDEFTLEKLRFDYTEEVELEKFISAKSETYFNIWVNVFVNEANTNDNTNEFRIKIRYKGLYE